MLGFFFYTNKNHTSHQFEIMDVDCVGDAFPPGWKMYIHRDGIRQVAWADDLWQTLPEADVT